MIAPIANTLPRIVMMKGIAGFVKTQQKIRKIPQVITMPNLSMAMSVSTRNDVFDVLAH
jgi:hypothetical protein